jgi:hypothetical protein
MHRTMLSIYPTRDIDDMHILWGPNRLHQLSGAVTTPLFRHLGLSSWHSADGAIVHFFKFGPAGHVLALAVRLGVITTVLYIAIRCWRWYRSPSHPSRRRSMEKLKLEEAMV